MSDSSYKSPHDRRSTRRPLSLLRRRPPARSSNAAAAAAPPPGPSSMSRVTTVETSNQMKAILDGGDGSNLVVLEFMAPWSEPCKNMEQVYEEVASKDEFRRNNVQFLKVNFDKFQYFAAKLQVEAMPLFLMIKGREVIDRIVAIDKEELSGKIIEVLHAQGRPLPIE